MRKRHIAMARAYLAFYILFVFAAPIPAFLLTKFSNALTVVFIVIPCLMLGGVIASNVFYDKHMDKAFYLSGMISYLSFDILVLAGLIIEIIYTLNGEPAVYAWVISILSLLILGVIDLFVALGMYRLKHPLEE